jgi:hypothetical protein
MACQRPFRSISQAVRDRRPARWQILRTARAAQEAVRAYGALRHPGNPHRCLMSRSLGPALVAPGDTARGWDVWTRKAIGQ